MDMSETQRQFEEQFKEADTIAKRLKLLMRLQSVTGKKLADMLQVSEATISGFLSGKTTKLYAQTVFDLSKVFQVDPEWLYTGDGSPEIRTKFLNASEFRTDISSLTALLNEYGFVPVKSKAKLAQDFEIVSKRFLRTYQINDSLCQFYSVSGDEMSPIICDNDSVLVEKAGGIVNGKIYALLCKDGAVIARRLYKKLSSSEVILKCEREGFQDEIIDFDLSELILLGRVISVHRRIIDF